MYNHDCTYKASTRSSLSTSTVYATILQPCIHAIIQIVQKAFFENEELLAETYSQCTYRY
jgi:hypothetical protein